MIKHQQLLEPNAKLIHLLPNNLQGLIQYDSIYNILVQSLDETVDDIDPISLKNQLFEYERKNSIDHTLIDLTVDQDKSLILSMLYGSTYIQALDLVLNNYIKFKSNANVNINLKDYLADPAQYPMTEFTIIIDQTICQRTIPKLLNKLGFKLQNGILMQNTNILDIPYPIGEEFTIDLSNWYCNCEEYQLQYTNNMKPIEITGKRTIIEQLLSSTESILLDPVPLCSHILSILILIYNKEKLYSRVN